jgi:hypothetical protein
MPRKGEMKKGAKPDSIRQRAYNSSPEQKKRRAERNASRAEVAKTHGGKAAIKGKDVDHKNHNTADKSKKNLSLMSPSKNRAMNQHDKRKR